MPYNASDRKQVRAAEKAAERMDIAKIDFLKSMLGSPGGRLWFYDLLESCHLFSDPFTGNPYQEAFLKGERNVGLRIFADITAHCPDQYISMMKDANVRRSELNAAINPDPASGYGGAPTQYSGGSPPRWDAEGSELEPANGDTY